MNICIFGDSITYGVNDLEMGGWVGRFRTYLENKNYDGVIYNQGVCGDNTEDLLLRFLVEAKAREPKIIIFAIGINDSQWLTREARNRVSLENFKQNLQQLINQAQTIVTDIGLIGLTPVNEEKTSPIPWNLNKSYKNKYIEKYNQAIKEIAKKNKLEFLDFFAELQKSNFALAFADGLHPDTNHHRAIFLKVKKFLKL